MPHAPAGFTFIELVLVCIVLSLLLLASIPRFQQTAQRLRLEHTAFGLAQLLRAAHERAIAEQREVVWAWDGGARRAQLYAVSMTTEVPMGEPIEERAAQSPPLAEGMALTVEYQAQPVGCPMGVADGAGCIRFLPDGTSEPALVSIGAQQLVYTVTVHEATGQVVLSRGPAAR